uniref:Uncharacterized protein n=1 Tax=Lactuca sativa TaxID=4236 RepID=A0A9R1XQR6_LACSA|nr:hypothetical protein LSAT_V11C300121940 [Lactuca sativa]
MNLFSDGSSCTKVAGSRLILKSPIKEEVTYPLRFNFQDNNYPKNGLYDIRGKNLVQYVEKVKALKKEVHKLQVGTHVEIKEQTTERTKQTSIFNFPSPDQERVGRNSMNKSNRRNDSNVSNNGHE